VHSYPFRWSLSLALVNTAVTVPKPERIESGWPLLTVETETNERSPPLVGLLGLSCKYKRLLSCFSCSSRHSRKYFFFTLFQLICPHRPASWAGSPAGSPVSSYVSLAKTDTCKNYQRLDSFITIKIKIKVILHVILVLKQKI
jgi:hypothetical protein